MATVNLSSEHRSEKKINNECKCKVCGKKAVNGVTCCKCGFMLHFKCANIPLNKETHAEKWVCTICASKESLEDSFHEISSEDLSQVEIKFILSENKLLKKLLQEMEEKNVLLKEKIKYLTSYENSPPEDSINEPVKKVKTNNTIVSNQTVQRPVLSVNKPVSSVTKESRDDNKTSLPTHENVPVRSVANNINKNITLNTFTNVTKESLDNIAVKDNSDNFQLVINKRRKKKATSVVGSNDMSDGLQAAPKKAWLFIGKLLTNTTEDQLLNYVKKKIPNEEFSCTKITTSSTSSCFKLGAGYHLRQQLENPEFWPRGVIVRQYIFRRRASPTITQ